MGYYSGDNANMVSKGLHAPKPGLNSVGEYQVAGRPFVKSILGSTIDALIIDGTDTALGGGDIADQAIVEFPFITSRLVVSNQTDQPIAVYFCSLTVVDGETANSGVKVNHNYFIIPKPESAGPSYPKLDINVKCRKVYIAGYQPSGSSTAPSSGTVSIAAELTNIEEPYDCDVDNIDGISG